MNLVPSNPKAPVKKRALKNGVFWERKFPILVKSLQYESGKDVDFPSRGSSPKGNACSENTGII